MQNGYAVVRAYASPPPRSVALVNGAPSAMVDGWGKSLATCLISIYLLHR